MVPLWKDAVYKLVQILRTVVYVSGLALLATVYKFVKLLRATVNLDSLAFHCHGFQTG